MSDAEQRATTTDYRQKHYVSCQEPTTGDTWGVWHFDATTRTLTCDPGPICVDGKRLDLLTCLDASKVLDCIGDIAGTLHFGPVDVGHLFLALDDILGFYNFSGCKTKAETETLILQRLHSLDQSSKSEAGPEDRAACGPLQAGAGDEDDDFPF
jgi:hypothetical protein